MMLTIKTRVRVDDDGTLVASVPGELPAGEHEVVIVAQAEQPRRKLSMKDFPVRDLPWDDSISLRREDMYGDDGR